MNLEVTTVPLADLKPWPGNARQGDVGAIVESLRHHGQYRPLVVQASTGHVIAGNHTLQAAHELGWQDIAVTMLDVDDDQAQRINIVDNRTQDLATNDEYALAQLLRDLAVTEDGLAGTGYDGDDLDDLLSALDAPDDFAMPDGEPDTHQVTFILTPEQKHEVDTALDAARKRNPPPDGVNGNAHALETIAATFNTRQGP